MLFRAIRVVFAGALLAAVAVPACGNTSDSEPTTSGGTGGSSSGGAGASVGRAGASGNAPVGAAGAATSECGSATCDSVSIAIPGEPALTIPACCSDVDTNTCGLDSSFLAAFGPTFPVACQALHQPGVADATCPESAKTQVGAFAIGFPGCCRSNGTCGYQLDSIGGLYRLNLGCVDSAPFLDGGTPQACGDAAGGQGGAGQGGAGGASASGGASGADEVAAGGVAGG